MKVQGQQGLLGVVPQLAGMAMQPYPALVKQQQQKQAVDAEQISAQAGTRQIMYGSGIAVDCRMCAVHSTY
jgi:hypothetical protein